MNWITECGHPLDVKPEIVALYDKNPRDRNVRPFLRLTQRILTLLLLLRQEHVEPRVKLYASDYPTGFYRTKIKFGHPWLPGNWEYHENLTYAYPGHHCFPYWITSIRDNEIIDSKCLDIQPTWMNDNRY